MNVTAYVSGIASQIASTPPSAVPGMIMNAYTKYLWNYQPDSWVAKIAYSYRVLAFVIALPVITLGLLDIVSYGIARTLGIVDDVKASTSDKATDVMTEKLPVIHVSGESTQSSETYTDSDRESVTDHIRAQHEATSNLLNASEPRAYYASDSDGLKLAGADLFSPAVSEPSSPTIPRKSPFEGKKIQDDNGERLGEGLRYRPSRTGEAGN